MDLRASLTRCSRHHLSCITACCMHAWFLIWAQPLGHDWFCFRTRQWRLSARDPPQPFQGLLALKAEAEARQCLMDGWIALATALWEFMPQVPRGNTRLVDIIPRDSFAWMSFWAALPDVASSHLQPVDLGRSWVEK
eukprot:1486172-Pyramimonas_sp.AAC.1